MLRDCVMFTIPVLLPLLYVGATAWIEFRNVRHYDDWWSARTHLRRLFDAQLHMGLRLPRAMALRQRLDPESADPGVLRLRVDRRTWNRVIEDPLSGWGVWVDGAVVQGNDMRPVRLRKRGDTSVHWTTVKKSFTLKTPKSSLFRGSRQVAVSGKNVLSAYLANRMQAELGVLAPSTTVAPVFVNDRFYGMFRLSEIIDESFLRRIHRVPGNIFRADAAERGEYYKGLPRNVFVNPYIWDRVSEGDVPGVPADSALLELLDAVNGSTFADHRRLMGLVDRDEIARLMAALLVVGDPYHMSGVHNQYWYEDPSTGRLHPIPWDLRLLNLARPTARVNAFFQEALRDPFLVDETLHLLRVRLEDGSLQRRAEEITREAYTRFRPHFEYDRLRGELISDVGAPDEVLSRLAGNLRTLESWISDAGVRFRAGTDRDPSVLDLETFGYAGSDLTAIRLSGIHSTPQLYADRNLNGVLDERDPRIETVVERANSSRIRLRLAEPLALLQGWDGSGIGIRPGRIRYRLFLRTAAGEPASDAWLEVRNRLTGEPAHVVEWDSDRERRPREAWSPWRSAPPASPRTIRLSGDVHLSQTLELRAGELLLISPGTRLRLDPDVSILSHGRIEARGTATLPIRFLPAREGKPWGTLALQGPGADGSRFTYTEFTGGGGAVLERVPYTGMVSVHRARDVRFEHSRFVDNLRSDDAFHAVHARVSITDGVFLRANSDAIDFDYSDGEIRDCRIESARNDGIDLMGSSPRIVRNQLLGNSDKGISVGEESAPLIVGNRISGSPRGVEVKDGSRPILLHDEITGNGIGVLEQVKIWRYGAGGRAILAYTRVAGNDRNLKSDASSTLTIWDSPIGVDSATSGGVSRPAGPAPLWIYAHYGIRGGPYPPGLPPAWTREADMPPLYAESFRETLATRPPAWRARGGVTRIRVADAALRARVERRPGAIEEALQWDLSDQSKRYQAAMELSGRDLASVQLVFESDGSEIRQAVELPADPTRFRLVTLDLPAGRY
ncbi:MAG: CotH kinase family protein, partial [Gemmatimonadota bacterium]